MILYMKSITKMYSNGIIANENVSFSVQKGEIHALMGENGAGKSTLMNILFGNVKADYGEIILNGEKIEINNQSDAINHKIGMVHQHFMQIPSLTIAENVFLGIEPTKNGIFDKKTAEERVLKLARKYSFDINPKDKIGEVSIGTKQKVEILKSLVRGAEILILDEPTAVLTPQETKEFFNQLKILKEKGQTIIFISHKLQEVKEICDRITIMKDGKSVGSNLIDNLKEIDISKMMVGREISSKIEKNQANFKENILEIKNLSYKIGEKSILSNINLRIRKGEILGVIGVDGNGQSELVDCIFGVKNDYSGKILMRKCDISSVKDVRKLKIAHIPQDRLSTGTASNGTILENLISTKINDFGLIFNNKRIKKHCRKLIKEFKIKCESCNQKISMLSGGNMQKVVVAREISGNPMLLIANQPSRGVDIGANELIYNKILKIRDEGSAVMLISADLNEAINLSDTLIIVYNGEIVAYIEDTNQVNQDEIGEYMLGMKKETDIKERMFGEEI